MSATPTAGRRAAWLRWLGVPLAGAAVWWTVLLSGVGAMSLLDALCPPDLVISGMCTAAWHGWAVEALIFACSAVVAAGLVLLPAWVAPAHRFPVAILFFVGGAGFALWFAWGGDAWGPFVRAALGGCPALARAASLWRAAAPAA